MKTIKKELTRVSHRQPEQLNEGKPFFNHGHLSWIFIFKIGKEIHGSHLLLH